MRFRKSFSGRAGIVLFGSLLGQGVALLSLPIIAQIYPVDVLGRAATSLAILNILSIIICFQYDQAVIVAEKKDLPYLMTLSVCLIVAWILVLGLFLGVSKIFWIRGNEYLLSSGVNKILLFLIMGYAPFLLLTNLRLRQDKLVVVSMGRLAYYGGGALLQIAGGSILEKNESTYLIAQGIAAMVATGLLFPGRETLQWFRSHRPQLKSFLFDIMRVMKGYSNFPKYQASAGLLNASSVQLPVIIMAAGFSDAWAGWYFMAWRLLAAPTTLLSQAVGQIFYRDSAERERNGIRQDATIEKIVVSLIQISLIPALMLFIVSPNIVSIFLGNEWLPVSMILQILLISFVAAFFTSPISTILNVKNLQKSALGFNVLIFFGRLGGMLLGWVLFSPLVSVVAYSGASLIVYLLFSGYAIRSCGGNIRRVFKRVIPLLLDVFVILVIYASLFRFSWINEIYPVIFLLVLAVIGGWRELNRTKNNQSIH